jgi:hypothetical protein
MRYWLGILCLIVALWLLTFGLLALAGKELHIDTSCYLTLDFDDGCVPGKPYRIGDR